MKNRFGFIPIVLPAIVMVLIIGLINLTGPQAAQAQEADVSEESARLTTLGLTHGTGDGESDDLLMPMFDKGRGSYTAKVDYAVASVNLTATGIPTGYTASYASTGKVTTDPAVDLTDGTAATITLPDPDDYGKTTITVTVTDGGTGDDAKMAKYVIVLTQMEPVVKVGGPRLSVLGLVSDPGDASTAPTTGDVTLVRMDGGAVTFSADTNGINMFKASVPVTARSVVVVATPATTPNGITVSSITPPDRKAVQFKADGTTPRDDVTANDADDVHRVPLGIGSNTIRVRTTASGANAEYTIMVTRRAPELGTSGIALTVSDGSTAPALDPTYDSMTREYMVKVPFSIDSTTVTAIAGTAAANSRVAFRRITVGGRLATTSLSHNVPLSVGKTVVGIETDEWVRSLYNVGEDDTATTDIDERKGSTSTGKYTVTIEREKPKLAAAGADEVTEGTGLRLRYKDGQVGDAGSTPPAAGTDPVSVFGLNKMYDPDTMAYKATVPYQHTRVTLHAMAGTSPASGSATNKVRWVSPGDADGAVIGFQVDLTPGVKKTVTVRAESSKDRRIYTEYTVELTLTPTSLHLDGDVFALCAGEPTSDCTNNTATGTAYTAPDMVGDQIGLHESRPAGSNSTSTVVEFDPDTTTYYAAVPYWVDSTTLRVDAGDDGGVTRIVKHTMPTATTSESVTEDLDVGDNVFKVDVGVTGNTSTYMVTVEREEPVPEIQFELLDTAGQTLGAGPLSIDLDAAFRNYNFIDETGLNADTLLTATDVKICVADWGGKDDVRVSISGVTVPHCDDNSLERELDEGTTTLVFDIDFPGDSAGSAHTVTISGNPNSVPMFPSNHILRSRTGDNGVLAVHGQMITPTQELPMAMGGNGALMYQLLSQEAGGPSTNLPQGLTYDLPDKDGNGQLGMSPDIVGSSDRAVFNLILKVWDSDAVKGASDEDTIPFTIIVFRDESLLPPGTTVDPRLGDLIDLEVHENGKDKLMPAFSVLRNTYTADVFTDTTEVDFIALASSSAEVRLEGSVTSDKTATTTDAGTGMLHKWEGYELRTGAGARNTYRLTVTDGTGDDRVTRTYTVTVNRQLPATPRFSSDRAVKEYYEGIALSELPKMYRNLPTATGGNGDLSYTLERREDLAPTQDKMKFLGLEKMGTSSPYLSGTPVLDANADRRLSDRSEAYGTYTVHDSDMDRNASDADTMNVDVKVYRNVALGSYTVGGQSKTALGMESKVYNSNRRYSHVGLEGYRFNAAHDASVVTFAASPMDTRDAKVVSITPADANASMDGYQVNLARGDNEVTVVIGNGVVRGTHVINIKRPGLQLTGITITEDEDERDDSRLTDEVKLSPAFGRDTYEYTAMVNTWVRSVRVSATAADPNARVFVNTFEIPAREGYSVVDLRVGATTTITLGASVGTDEPDPRYTIAIYRMAGSVPVFTMEAMDYTRREGVRVDMAPCQKIILPKATGGDGDPVYYLLNEEELPPGLSFDASTREISGIPTLDEGFESDFDLVYAVRDSDGDRSDGDRDTSAFTITITNDVAKAAEACAEAPVEPVAPANTLSSLVVTYTLDGRADISATLNPEFMPTSNGPYTAVIPHGATDVQVTAVRADQGATISMNDVRIASGVKLDLPPNATITVRHPDFTDSMSYTLTTSRVSDTAPTFGGESIDNQVFESGMDIDVMRLPMATGGNRTITYTLVDHEGNLPDGLMFDPSSRELSGRPALVQDADSTLYRMTYKATDADGQSDMIEFDITVCDPDRASGCVPTMPEPNPGSMPMDLEVSISGNTATLNWRPGDDAMRQFVGAVDPTATDIIGSIRPAPAGDAQVAADADMYTIENLPDGGADYVFVVAGWDGSMWHVAVFRQ